MVASIHLLRQSMGMKPSAIFCKSKLSFRNSTKRNSWVGPFLNTAPNSSIRCHPFRLQPTGRGTGVSATFHPKTATTLTCPVSTFPFRNSLRSPRNTPPLTRRLSPTWPTIRSSRLLRPVRRNSRRWHRLPGPLLRPPTWPVPVSIS